MQQAYRMLRVVAEAQTIRMVLTLAPHKLLLQELCSACTTLASENNNGIKAVVLDFKEAAHAQSTPDTEKLEVDEAALSTTVQAIRAIPAPVLAVVRDSVSSVASALIAVADLSIVEQHASLMLPVGNDTANETLTGVEAWRLRLVNWSVPAKGLEAEMERVLGMLRNKSGVALRLAKESTRLGTTKVASEQGNTANKPLDKLKQINEFYLTHVMQTTDAAEGLHAFVEKREPRWKNS